MKDFLNIQKMFDDIEGKFSDEVKNHMYEKFFLRFSFFTMLLWIRKGESKKEFSLALMCPKKWHYSEVFDEIESFLGLQYIKYFDLHISGYDDYEYKGIESFFFNQDFFKIPEKELYKFQLKVKDGISNKEFDDLIKGLQSKLEVIYTAYYNFGGFKNEKKILYNKIESLYNVYGNEFEVDEGMFTGNSKVSLIYALISFYCIGFISITSLGFSNDENGKNCYCFGIKLSSEFKGVIQGITQIKEVILDKVFDEKYKQITVKKKEGKAHLLESDIEYLGDETRFIELQKKYPHSKIEADNYGGKIHKYKVKEKIKLDKDNTQV